ncbi:CLUMA_CG015598, isoform A [Clunio marinus]|uniref:CLUMA_CG015598, isoform A n=1 Tax=Clunio marinus TaxID=568069 RepID=A0A1J1IQ29_9DIPT|nr:CLUMA_CG015598, isoform A [Clunio marinus]
MNLIEMFGVIWLKSETSKTIDEVKCQQFYINYNSIKIENQIIYFHFASGSMGHGTQNNPWMKLMGIVSHKDRRHDNQQSQSGSNERALNM